MKRSKVKHHAHLVDEMAKARGLDLQDAAIQAGLRPYDISDMVLLCAGCPKSEVCEVWLASQVGAVSDTPPYCRNADLLRAVGKLASGQ